MRPIIEWILLLHHKFEAAVYHRNLLSQIKCTDLQLLSPAQRLFYLLITDTDTHTHISLLHTRGYA